MEDIPFFMIRRHHLQKVVRMTSKQEKELEDSLSYNLYNILKVKLITGSATRKLIVPR